MVINAAVTLTAGLQYSVYAVVTLATIGPLVTVDHRRRLATQASENCRLQSEGLRVARRQQQLRYVSVRSDCAAMPTGDAGGSTFRW